MRHETPFNFIRLVFFIGVIILASSEFAFAQTILKEQNKTKDFGKSLKKYDKKNIRNSKDFKDNDKNSTEDEETIRIKTDLVISNVLVLNQKGNVIAGLKQSDFLVTEDGIPQEISVFSHGQSETVPRSIVLIIDHSGSIGPYIENSIKASKNLVDKLKPQDKMAIVTDDVELLADFTNDKTLLKNKLDSLQEKTLSKIRGKSFQYSALLAVLNEMFDEDDIIRLVIFQSDGDEIAMLKGDKESLILPKTLRVIAKKNGFGEERSFGFGDIKEAIKNSRVTIYSVIPKARFTGFSREEQLKRAKLSLQNTYRFYFATMNENHISRQVKKFQSLEIELRLGWESGMIEVAKLSGGYADFIEKPEDAENVFSTIFTTFENKYIVGYYPINPNQDGKSHNIKIEIRGHPEYMVVGRKTYFAPETK